jgi:hypothetical protein
VNRIELESVRGDLAEALRLGEGSAPTHLVDQLRTSLELVERALAAESSGGTLFHLDATVHAREALYEWRLWFQRTPGAGV